MSYWNGRKETEASLRLGRLNRMLRKVHINMNQFRSNSKGVSGETVVTFKTKIQTQSEEYK